MSCCPHCAKYAHFEWNTAHEWATPIDPGDMSTDTYVTKLVYAHCPACMGLLLELHHEDIPLLGKKARIERIFPLGSMRPLSSEVPGHYRAEFLEACNVEAVSPKASAAFSRRLLQRLLHEEVKIQDTNLSTQIENFVSRSDIPPDLADQVDFVRVIGNFGAHPIKATNTGEIVEVEPEEASWSLDVLECLLEFLFVQPAMREAKRQRINAKLEACGKPPMKTPRPR